MGEIIGEKVERREGWKEEGKMKESREEATQSGGYDVRKEGREKGEMMGGRKEVLYKTDKKNTGGNRGK